MHIGTLLDDCEAQSRPVAHGADGTVKALEHLLALRVRYADAGIVDAEVGIAVNDAAPQCHRAATGRVAQCVVDQVGEHFREQRFVADDACGLELEAQIDVSRNRRCDPLGADALGQLV